jgi:ABC-type bacteriocin/lantibiotic exporter with double-glycine peptidase domain
LQKKNSKKYMKTPFERFWLLLKPDKKEIYQIYTYAVFKGMIALSLPLGIQSIINLIQGGQVSTSWIILVLFVVAGIAIGGFMQLFQMRITETIQQKIFTRAAFDFTYRIPKIKFEEISKYYAPELMNRFFDVLTLQKSLAKIFIELPTAILQITFGLILLSLYHPFFILFSVLLVSLVILIIRLTVNKGLRTSLEESKFKYKVVSWLEELARTKDSFKLAGKTILAEQKTDERVVGYINSRENHFNIIKLQYILLLSFKIIVALGLLIAGGLLVINQQLNIGQFVAAEIIIILVLDSSEKIVLALEDLFDILTSLEKIGEVADLELDLQSNSKSLNEDINTPIEVEISNVIFTYPNRPKPIINNLNFTFKSNRNYCIIGNNESGKSTLLHLISGLYQPHTGNICMNGFPVNNYNLCQLYRVLGNGLVEESVFDGTLYENITLGRDYLTIDDVKRAIKHSQLEDYLKTLPLGLDSPIGNSNTKVSRSLTQRIIIARSIVNRPKLLLFEVQFNLIEEETRNKIIDFITNKQNNWTLICVSTNEYLKSSCDEVITLSNGQVVH